MIESKARHRIVFLAMASSACTLQMPAKDESTTTPPASLVPTAPSFSQANLAAEATPEPDLQKYDDFRRHVFGMILDGKMNLPAAEEFEKKYGQEFVKNVYIPVLAELKPLSAALKHPREHGVLIGLSREDLKIRWGLFEDLSTQISYLFILADPAATEFAAIVFEPKLGFRTYARSVAERTFSGQVFQNWSPEQPLTGNMLSGIDLPAGDVVVLRLGLEKAQIPVPPEVNPQEKK